MLTIFNLTGSKPTPCKIGPSKRSKENAEDTTNSLGHRTMARRGTIELWGMMSRGGNEMAKLMEEEREKVIKEEEEYKLLMHKCYSEEDKNENADKEAEKQTLLSSLGTSGDGLTCRDVQTSLW